MAEHKLSGNDILLFIDPAGGTTYDTVICLTNQTWKGGVSIIDASTKCGPDSLPGKPNPQTVTFDGQHIYDATTGRISGPGLLPLMQNSTTIGWKISPVVLQNGDEILTGTGFISELDKAYSDNSPATFTGTISIYGQTTQEIYVD